MKRGPTPPTARARRRRARSEPDVRCLRRLARRRSRRRCTPYCELDVQVPCRRGEAGEAGPLQGAPTCTPTTAYLVVGPRTRAPGAQVVGAESAGLPRPAPRVCPPPDAFGTMRGVADGSREWATRATAASPSRSSAASSAARRRRRRSFRCCARRRRRSPAAARRGQSGRADSSAARRRVHRRLQPLVGAGQAWLAPLVSDQGTAAARPPGPHPPRPRRPATPVHAGPAARPRRQRAQPSGQARTPADLSGPAALPVRQARRSRARASAARRAREPHRPQTVGIAERRRRRRPVHALAGAQAAHDGAQGDGGGGRAAAGAPRQKAA